MLNATDDHDLNCQDEGLSCYLIDTSGYVLAAGSSDHVQVGDFLGVADPQLMQHFHDAHLFRSRIEHNYQALCPTQIDCKTDTAGTVPRLFLSTLAQSLVSLMEQV